MASRRSTKAKADVEVKERPNSKDKELLARAREHYKLAVEADEENRRASMNDLKFLNVPGEQWDANQKKSRGKRPCYEFNKLRVAVKRVINEIRANRPQGKVRAVEDGDKDTADIYEGLIRNIWNNSDGDTKTDYAAEYQVGCGMGAWRVTTEYCNDSAFDQDIKIESIKNPFCLYGDPNATDALKTDGDFWILTEKVSEKVYKQRYPEAEAVDFEDNEFDDDEEWFDSANKTVRICEYWYKEPVKKEIGLLSNGDTVDLAEVDTAQLAAKGITVLRSRAVDSHQIMMFICSGNALLTKPTKWAGTIFPFVQIYGEWMVIDGKVQWWGLTRDGKDAQRSYNMSRTALTEAIASAPQSKFWATAKQMEGLSGVWREAHDKLFPFLPYNADPAAPGPPVRMGGPDVPVALLEEVQLASNEIKETTGVYDSRETTSDVQSGKAIIARERQGAIGNYNYQDNHAKGVNLTWKICVDLIPKIYDSERSIRILGSDGAQKYVKINTFQMDPKTGQRVAINDLGRGKFDVTITVGPSFATQRQEAANTYAELAQRDPALMPTAGDLVYKSMDLPYAEEIAERRRAMLPPPIQAMLNKDKPVPPEVQAAMQQVAMAQQQVSEQAAFVQQAAQEVQQDKAAADKAKADANTAIANIKTEQERFKAYVAQEMAKLAQKEAQLSQRVVQAQGDADQREIEIERKTLEADANQAAQQIQAVAEQFTQFAQQAMADIEQRRQQVSEQVDKEIAMLMQTAPQGMDEPMPTDGIPPSAGVPSVTDQPTPV